MFPDYLFETPATSRSLERAQCTLTGLEAALLCAILQAWQIKPCRDRMPCLSPHPQFRCQFNLRTAVATYWRLASQESQAEVQDRLLQLLFWRKRDYPIDEWLHGGMEEGQLADMFQEDFDNWCEEPGQIKCNSALRIVVRLVRLDPPATKAELVYCLEPLDTLSATRLNAAWLHLLTRVCQRVRITPRGEHKAVVVQFSPDFGPFSF